MSTNMRNDPVNFKGCSIQRLKSQTAGNTPSLTKNNTETTEHKEDLMIRDLYQNRTDSVHGICVFSTDNKSYLEKKSGKCLQEAARAKKKMYLEACLQKCCHFSPFASSADGLLDVEATATLKGISIRL